MDNLLLSTRRKTSIVLLLVLNALVLTTCESSTEKPKPKLSLENIFDRPSEPVFFPKGETNVVYAFEEQNNTQDKNIIYRTKAPRVPAGAVIVEVPAITIPTIRLARTLGPGERFSPFVPQHAKMAVELIDAFMRAPTSEEMLATTVYLRDQLNPFLLSYALNVAAMHRDDCSEELPLPAARFPEHFFPSHTVASVRRAANLNPEASQRREPVDIEQFRTASDLDVENRVAYFREDLGVNQNHQHFHTMYPTAGTAEVVYKDRRGEMFYYFHNQVLGRYNFERLSNQLHRVKRLLDWREPIEEGYFPHMDTVIASKPWPGRPAGTRLANLVRDDLNLDVDIQQLERWRDRIYDAIQSGRVLLENGTYQTLEEETGMDTLGNLLEATRELSVNYNYYGSLHNTFHDLIALCHDPDHRHMEDIGVVGNTATAMRDPVFYRWHAYIDGIFYDYKKTLTPYTEKQLGFEGIDVEEVQVKTEGVDQHDELHTFWQKSNIDLSRGVDFVPRGELPVRVKHLQHTPFAYHIKVHNDGAPRVGTVRILLAPSRDERGQEMQFREQQRFFIEMDKFRYNFSSGENNVVRQSNASSVAVPYERTFVDLSVKSERSKVSTHQPAQCSCGWPQYMLVPKGSHDGLRADLFVMVSNYEDDKVDPPPKAGVCSDGHSICGLFKQKYPDRRAMGFPFDRPPAVKKISDFLTTNMARTEIRIKFHDELRNVIKPSVLV